MVEKEFQNILLRAVEVGASDVHLKVGFPPIVRIHEDLKLLFKEAAPLEDEFFSELCKSILHQKHKEKFLQGQEVDFAYTLNGVGRFRLNVARSRGHLSLVGRFIPFEIRNIEKLGLPSVLRKLALMPRGLILLTGTAGSGKSTTLAAMLNEWNESRAGHIITIEDPVEYLLRDKKSIITQREVGLDTESFATGLKNALRQDPDVIMIGEMRDRETIQTAINAAETGHLVLSTLHTKDSIETINRIVGIFDPAEQREVRMQFASSLAGIVCQRMIPTAGAAKPTAGGVVVATEILINTPLVKDCLRDASKANNIRPSLEQGRAQYGTHSFDQCIMDLLSEGKISREMAIRYASNPADFELRLRGIEPSSNTPWQRGASGENAGPTPDDVDPNELKKLSERSLEMDAPPLRPKIPPKK